MRRRFADSEIYVQIQDSIRGCDFYLVQPTCKPVNDYLTELMIVIDQIFSSPVIIDYLLKKQLSGVVVVSPDIGGVTHARAFAKRLNDPPLAIIDKRRPSHNQAEIMNVVGDVAGKTAIVIDDMIETAGTISHCALALRQEGAHQVYACVSHALLSGPAQERLFGGLFEEVIVTNTIPAEGSDLHQALTILSVADLLGETIYRIHQENSVSSLFQEH